MSEIRVLHLIGSKGLYGAEHVLLNLLPALKRSGIDVTLGCISRIHSAGADVGYEIRGHNLPVVFIDEERKLSLKSLYLIWEAIKVTHANILHTHGYKATILGGLLGWITGIPLVCTYHGEAKNRPEFSKYIAVENFLLRKAHRVFPVSLKIREELISRQVAVKKLSLIYNGIDDPLLCKGNGSFIKKENSFLPHLLCVGRLIISKRFDLAIEAVHILRKEHPHIRLSVAGDGPYRSNLEQKVKDLKLENNVTFLGYVKDMNRIYEVTNLFVLPSETEGCPVSVIQAMAFSLPIIVTSVGAVPEMVENYKHALVIAPNDLNRLTESIHYLISDEQICQALGGAARERFLTNFDSDVMAGAYVKQYEAVFQEWKHAGRNQNG